MKKVFFVLIIVSTSTILVAQPPAKQNSGAKPAKTLKAQPVSVSNDSIPMPPPPPAPPERPVKALKNKVTNADGKPQPRVKKPVSEAVNFVPPVIVKDSIH